MFLNIIDWSTVLKVIVNTILVSIPEETFLVMFTLILLKQFDFLESKKDAERKFKKRDILEISFVVLPVSLLSNILRFSKVDVNVILLTSFMSLAILIIIVYKVWSAKGIVKSLFSTLMSFLILMLIEFPYAALIVSVTGKSFTQINNSIILNFLITIPERLLDYFVILYLLFKKVSFLRANLIKPILSSKFLCSTVLFTFIFNMFLFACVGKLIWFDKILVNYSLMTQVIIIVAVILIPIFNILAVLVSIYYVRNRESYSKYLSRMIMKRITEDLKSFTNDCNYTKIKLTLTDLEANVSDLFD